MQNIAQRRPKPNPALKKRIGSACFFPSGFSGRAQDVENSAGDQEACPRKEVAISGVERELCADRTGIDYTGRESSGADLDPFLGLRIDVAVGINEASDARVTATRHGNPVLDAAENGMGEMLLGLGRGIEPGIVGLIDEPARAGTYSIHGKRCNGILEADQHGKRILSV